MIYENGGLIYQALNFAKHAHKGQFRKYTKQPYITHPIRVAAMVMERDLSEHAIAAALLHDVVEDTDYTLENITGRFGTEIGKLVDDLTNKPKDKKLSREVRKKIDRDRLADVSVEAKIIKLLDRFDNLSDMGLADLEFRNKYATESMLLVDVIGNVDPELAEWVRNCARNLCSY